MSEKLLLMQDLGKDINSSRAFRCLPRAHVQSIKEAIHLAKTIGGIFYIEEEGKPATEIGYQHQVFIEKIEQEWKNDDQKEFD